MIRHDKGFMRDAKILGQLDAESLAGAAGFEALLPEAAEARFWGTSTGFWEPLFIKSM